MAERHRRLGIALWLPLAWIALVAVVAAGADLWPLPAPDTMHWDDLAAPVGADPHILGTDSLGRDTLSRLVHGARVSLSIGLLAPPIGLVIGGLLGMIAGYYRGPIDAVAMVLIDTMLAFPNIVFLLAVVAVVGQGLATLTVVLGLFTVPAFTRVARANTLKVAASDYVLAARAAGAGDLSILMREILPNIAAPVGVTALVVVAYLIVAEGVFSYLGLGVPEPLASWGGMIAHGQQVLEVAPQICLIPALVLFLTVLSFNLIGDTMRRRLDPREASK